MLMPFHFAYHVPIWTKRAPFTAVSWAVPRGAAPTHGSISISSATRSACIWANPFANAPTGKVGDHMVPMPHFGLVLDVERFQTLADRLRRRAWSS